MTGLGNEDALILGVLGGIQVLGLLSAAVARLSEGSRRQASSQRFFLGCLGLVGGTTMLCLGLWPGCWLASGSTLAVMVLGVTCDFGRSRRATAFY